MAVGAVCELWRYPVKSMRGERLTAAEVSTAGIAGDRGRALADLESGKVLSAKREPRLLEASAAWREGRPEVLLPGEVRVDADGDAAGSALTGWLGRPVAVVGPDPRRGAVFEMDLDPDDPTQTTDLRTPPGSLFDSTAALHLLSTASLRAAARLHPDGVWVAARFRPNVVLDTGAEGFVEDAWVGAELRLGEVVARVRRTTQRCVLTTRAQPGLPRDPAILRSLGRRDAMLGVYLDVLRPGTLRVGDPVLLPA